MKEGFEQLNTNEIFDREKERSAEWRMKTEDLMSWKEFMERYTDGDPPEEDSRYSVEGEGEYAGKAVNYFGTKHSKDPEHPMFQGEIEDALRQAQPQQVFVEGIVALQGDTIEREIEKLNNMSRDEVIRVYGEAGFTAKLAIEQGINVESHEPNIRDEVKNLVKQRFSKNEIFAFYFYREIPSYQRGAESPQRRQFEEYIRPSIERFRQATNWKNFDYSFGHAIGLGEKIWNRDFALEDNFYNNYRTGPFLSKSILEQGEGETVINRISRRVEDFRDLYIVNETDEALKDNDRLFILYGDAHTVRQRPAIEKLLKKDRG